MVHGPWSSYPNQICWDILQNWFRFVSFLVQQNVSFGLTESCKLRSLYEDVSNSKLWNSPDSEVFNWTFAPSETSTNCHIPMKMCEKTSAQHVIVEDHPAAPGYHVTDVIWQWRSTTTFGYMVLLMYLLCKWSDEIMGCFVELRWLPVQHQAEQTQ